MKFLIDECLSRHLGWLAQRHGYDADHVDLIGLKGTLDPELMPVIVRRESTFVTNNRRDFLRLFSLENPHAGLIVIRPSVRIPLQLELFEVVLADLHTDPEMANRLLEVDYGGQLEIIVRRFDLAGDAPAGG